VGGGVVWGGGCGVCCIFFGGGGGGVGGGGGGVGGGGGGGGFGIGVYNGGRVVFGGLWFLDFGMFCVFFLSLWFVCWSARGRGGGGQPRTGREL